MSEQLPQSKTTAGLLSGARCPSRTFVVVVLFVLAAAGIFVDLHQEQADLNLALRDQRETTLREASLLASRIEAETNSTFYLIVGLASYIEMNGGISEAEFQKICAQTVSTKKGLRNIAAAPDMVIRYIYPIQGNEAAMGLDYSILPAQREAAFRVKATGKPVIAGPLTLVQGGEAVVGRFPVYTRNAETGEKVFWGIISTPLDTSVLYEEAGLKDSSLGIEVSLRGKDSLGAGGDIFYGSADIYSKEPVRFPIELLSGAWEMAAVPVGGWVRDAPNAVYVRAIVGAIILLLGLVVCLVYFYLLRVQYSREHEAEVIRMKSRFYANMSHELRTPLNGVCGLSELIELTSDDAEQREYAKAIRQSAETLTALLDDVLVLSRMERAQHSSECRRIRLGAFLAELVPPLIYQAKLKQISFTVVPIPAECELFQSDPAMLRQILWNLLSNAVKFTNEGEVRLEVEAVSSEMIRFSVFDTGIGIAEEKLDVIFLDFTQEDDSNTRRYGGAGLGLAIVKRFVELLGGTISVESEKGAGSCFVVCLPREALPEPLSTKKEEHPL